MPDEVEIRRARPEDADAAVPLLYMTAPGMYDAMAGSPERAQRLIRRAFLSSGTDASREVCWVAELEGEVAGLMAAFPASEGASRSRRMLLLTLLSSPPRGWPRWLRLYRRGHSLPDPPGRDTSFYVDALATDPARRRSGVGRALLDEAARVAGRLGLPSVHLDTETGNAQARATYEAVGFELRQELPAGGGIPGQAAYARPVP